MYTLYFLNLHVKKFLYVHWMTATVQTMERQKPSTLKMREKRKDQSFHCRQHIVQVDQDSDTINVNTSQ